MINLEPYSKAAKRIRINILIKTQKSRRLQFSKFERTQIFNLFRKFAVIKGIKGAEFDERLVIVEGKYFSKNKANAFSNPDLQLFSPSKILMN